VCTGHDEIGSWYRRFGHRPAGAAHKYGKVSDGDSGRHIRSAAAWFVSAVERIATAPTASKADLAYETLRRWIADGTYQPGDRLVLDRLARELHMSVVPVREAIRRLEAEGYANFQRNVGARVASIDLAAYRETMETLAILEGAATALAAPNLTKRDLDTAARINDQMARGIQNLEPVSFTKRNKEFHETLYRRCGNRHLLTLIDREWSSLSVIRRSTFAFVPERTSEAVAEHSHLLLRLGAGAPPAEIELLLREHRMATALAFLSRAAAASDGAGLVAVAEPDSGA
jgi:DNA-binding GntR family transcriptional regulator